MRMVRIGAITADCQESSDDKSLTHTKGSSEFALVVYRR
jgi:hypothetical protein